MKFHIQWVVRGHVGRLCMKFHIQSGVKWAAGVIVYEKSYPVWGRGAAEVIMY
ncbi:MAG: hypothetical protein K0Q63_2514, partial [Paenibacillus sp.]|nr:hypothetical protein [Paenibacillus sp.]